MFKDYSSKLKRVVRKYRITIKDLYSRINVLYNILYIKEF